jgi:hypothetical protein
MNERIQELVGQAKFVAEETLNKQISKNAELDAFAEKFAELIVRECMSTVLKESKWYWDKDEFESSNAIQNAARRLKQHFGVE